MGSADVVVGLCVVEEHVEGECLFVVVGAYAIAGGFCRCGEEVIDVPLEVVLGHRFLDHAFGGRLELVLVLERQGEGLACGFDVAFVHDARSFLDFCWWDSPVVFRYWSRVRVLLGLGRPVVGWRSEAQCSAEA